MCEESVGNRNRVVRNKVAGSKVVLNRVTSSRVVGNPILVDR